MNIQYKAVIFFLAVAAAFTAVLPASEEARVWRTRQGGKIEAVWDRANSSGSTIRLVRETNGKAVTVEISDLTDEDQKYVEERTEQMQREEPARKIAFLVGVNHYENLIDQDLEWCIDDVRAVEKRLLEIGFAKENITVLTDAADTEIENALDGLEKEIAEGDLVFLLFTGHGRNIGTDSYFCPKNLELTADLPHAIKVSDIIEKIGKRPSFLKYFVFDMCRDSGEEQTFFPVPRRTIISYACTSGELSSEYDELGHGLFCYSLLKGLRGNADTDKDGKITMPELHMYAQNTARETREWLQNTKKQDIEVQLPVMETRLERELSTYAFLTADMYGEKRTKRIRGVDYTFCWCPSGTVKIHDKHTSISERRKSDRVKPKEEPVNGFWILESEVTQEMWQSVMGENSETLKQRFVRNRLPASDQAVYGPSAPMGCVTFKEAEDFCNRLGVLLNESVALPTNAQWTYASLSGVEDYSDEIDRMGWYGENSNGKMHRIKTAMPNAWGLYDTFGNVMEWCADLYDDTLPFRVTKGGGWNATGSEYTAGAKIPVQETDSRPELGFRPVLIPTGRDFCEGYLRSEAE